MKLTKAEELYYDSMLKFRDCGLIGAKEFAFVEAGLGGGFESTSELHVMKYKQVIKLGTKRNGTELFIKSIKRCKVWGMESNTEERLAPTCSSMKHYLGDEKESKQSA